MTLDETSVESSPQTTFSVARALDIKARPAREIAAEVGAGVNGWRQATECNGLTPPQIDRMESAFEHIDIAKAVAA